jgi:hypothetical protein
MPDRGRFSSFPIRSLRAPVAVALVLASASLYASGCSGDGSSEEAATTNATAAATTATTATAALPRDVPETITALGSRRNTGPFERSLSLKLVKGIDPVPFYVCGAWGKEEAPEGCQSKAGVRLPAGSVLRLEQRPPGPAIKNPDSPGWGTVGTSETPELTIPLSNGVTGDRLGKVAFRVTLRNRTSGKVLATSNLFTLTWHE